MNAGLLKNSADTCYLTEVSPRDKPWDVNRALADKVRDLYKGTVYSGLSERISACSGLLEFGWVTDSDTGEARLKLKACRFCRVRHCPVCQWRRSLMWVARFLKALPAIQADHPKARYLFLTLTVKNCPLDQLRSTIGEMNRAWKRMTLRRSFPGIGFAKSVEITRGKDDSAHPHFHVLLMVSPSYFKSGKYLSQEKWTALWKESLRIQYNPIVNIKAIHSNPKKGQDMSMDNAQALSSAIVETFKYSVKPSDLIQSNPESNSDWLVQLTQELHKTRAIALGGVFKNYLSEDEPEDLIGEEENGEETDKNSLYFGWREIVSKYLNVG